MTDSRIDLIMNFLGENPVSFAERLGTSKEYIYMIQKGSRPISKQLANKIQDVFGIPKQFSLTGEGEIDTYPQLMSREHLIKEGLDHIVRESSPTLSPSGRGVPYYDVDFIGGFDLVFENNTVNPSYYIDFVPFNNADYWINVTGKSMGPLIAHGDIVALKKVDDWQSFLVMEDIYAIITSNNLRTIKILETGHDEDHYLLVPYNKSHKTQPIPKKVITHVFKVIGCIKKFF